MAKQDWDEKAWDCGLDLKDVVSRIDAIDYRDSAMTRFAFEHLQDAVAQSIEKLQQIQKRQRHV